MTKITRDQTWICLDENALLGVTAETPKWVRIRKSTISEIQYNAQTETMGYIDTPNDTTEITGYAPTMEQETLIETEGLYPAVAAFARRLPIGASAKVPALIVYYNPESAATTDGDLYADASVTAQASNFKDGIVSFTINLNGTPQKVIVASSEGEITTTPAAA